MANFLRIVSIISYILAFIFFIVSTILWFYFDISKIRKRIKKEKAISKMDNNSTLKSEQNTYTLIEEIILIHTKEMIQ